MSDTPTSPDPAAAAPAADVDPAEAARLKREARKARILSKGSDRLARITNTGRGEGASAYLKDNTPSMPSTPQSSSNAGLPRAAVADDDDPLEVDISTLPMRGPPRGEDATNPFAMFGGGEGAGQQDPMQALMAMMQGGGGMGGMGGSGGPGMGADGQPDTSGLPPQLAAMMQQFGAGGPGGPGLAPQMTATRTKSVSERAFDLLQAVLVLALAVLAAKSSLFDFDRSSVVPDAVTDTFEKISPSSASSTLRRWARLGYQKPSVEEWATLSPTATSFLPTSTALPLFWIFLSLELLLQAARIAIFSRKTPAPPSLLSTLTAMLPIPNLHLVISLISKYLALVNALVTDVCLLVFVFGAAVLWSGYELGGVGMLEGGVVPGFVHDEL
ncbi:hypothetical protein PSEUBRA_002033 [Kalmanozyma brasiliensis GHG001]|uniref:Golgi to ER traffic protein 2 n=1 Tax=Kalmanozyma brasiliensis (strain GHG001) TaxID=1365824 RepID=V5EXM4_KALBG|nr:uncharacterized protein PSEUBRA_002033 [Kalmanozyma brasiliensis GHG001]EST08283.1 hypothetical protein PSEUBRA_002033 [Kalmanozyma brasiliensis GHG001]